MTMEKPKRKSVEWQVRCPHCNKLVINIEKKVIRKWRKNVEYPIDGLDNILGD